MKEVFDVEFSKYRLTEKYKEFMDEKAKLESRQQQKKLIRTKLSDAPKKPPSAFALYRSEVMPSITAETKGLSTGELAKKVSVMWAGVPEEKRQPYQKWADEAKAIYDKRMLEFRRNKMYATYLKERTKVKLRENKLLNLRDAPKKPKSVFALYAETHKSEVQPGKGAGRGSSALKDKFAQAAQEEKEALEARSKELKSKYYEEVKSFKESDRYKTYEKTEKAVKRELEAAAVKLMTIKFLNAAPTQPPKSPFAVFVHEKRKATGAPEGGKKSKVAKQEEVLGFTKEWERLDKPSKAAYESTYRDRLTEWEGKVKTFMAQDIWKEYLAEAKEFKVPVKNLLAQKAKALKQLSGGAGMPSRPEAMPTRPPDAYKVFCGERGGEVNGDSERLLKMWEDMSVEAKAKYFTEAGKLLDSYEKDMAEFKKTDDGRNYFKEVGRTLRLRKIKNAKKAYLKDMPKAPPSALKVFMSKAVAELRKARPDLKGFEAKKQAEERWKAMDADERQALEDDARARLLEYQEKLGEFKRTPEFTKFTRARLVSTPPPKPSGMPVKPLNAFRAYCKEMKGLGRSKEELLKDFNELPEEDLATRKRKAKELEDDYLREVADFRKTAEWKAYKKQQFLHQKRANITLAKSKYCTGAPKKPPPAYQLFSSEKRGEIMKSHPDLKGAPATKTAEIWKGMSPEEKGPWLEKEKLGREEYLKAKEAYESTDEYKSYMKVVSRYDRRPKAKAAPKGKGRGRGAKVKPALKPPPEPEGMPQPPPASPVALFMRENKGKGYNLKSGNEAWVQLGAEGQKQYVDQLRELQSEYQVKFKEFQKSPEGKKHLRLKSAFEKRSKEQRARDKFLGGESAPKEPKRPQGAYFLFVGDRRESVAKELGSSKMGDVAKKLTELWGGLTPEDKQVYEDRAASLKQQYDKEMEEFRSSDGYKQFSRAVQAIKKKPKAKAKAAPKPSGRGGGAGRGRGRGAGRGAPAAASDSDSDAMGSDSSSSSSGDEDSD